MASRATLDSSPLRQPLLQGESSNTDPVTTTAARELENFQTNYFRRHMCNVGEDSIRVQISDIKPKDLQTLKTHYSIQSLQDEYHPNGVLCCTVDNKLVYEVKITDGNKEKLWTRKDFIYKRIQQLAIPLLLGGIAAAIVGGVLGIDALSGLGIGSFTLSPFCGFCFQPTSGKRFSVQEKREDEEDSQEKAAINV